MSRYRCRDQSLDIMMQFLFFHSNNIFKLITIQVMNGGWLSGRASYVHRYESVGSIFTSVNILVIITIMVVC